MMKTDPSRTSAGDLGVGIFEGTTIRSICVVLVPTAPLWKHSPRAYSLHDEGGKEDGRYFAPIKFGHFVW